MPSTEPKPVPRKIAQNDWRRSSRVGSTLPMREVKISCLSLRSRLITTSAMPKNAMAIATKPMPSLSSGWPKAKRTVPELTSVPTRPSRMPRQTMAIALMREPRASTTAAMSPNTMRENYSAGPNLSATSARSGAK